MLLDEHMTLLRKLPNQHALPEMTATPIFVMPILKYAETFLPPSDLNPFPQYDLLGGLSEVLKVQEESGDFGNPDPRKCKRGCDLGIVCTVSYFLDNSYRNRQTSRSIRRIGVLALTSHRQWLPSL